MAIYPLPNEFGQESPPQGFCQRGRLVGGPDLCKQEALLTGTHLLTLVPSSNTTLVARTKAAALPAHRRGSYDDRHSSWGTAVYGGAAVKDNTRRSPLLNAGLRYDYFADFGDTLNPRLGVIFNPWEKSLYKMLLRHGFQRPQCL